MRGIVFETSPIVFQAESTKTHLERTLHINSLYDNLDPGSYSEIRVMFTNLAIKRGHHIVESTSYHQIHMKEVETSKSIQF